MKSKGFTLIELMILIAIIGILAAIAIPQYQCKMNGICTAEQRVAANKEAARTQVQTK